MTARPIGDRGELPLPDRESLPGNATATPVLPVILPVIPVVILPREYYPAAINLGGTRWATADGPPRGSPGTIES